MTRPVLVDTGPLVAFLNRCDRYHEWARREMATIEPPLLTCEAVLSEACFLLRRTPRGPEAVVELVRRGLLSIAYRAADDSGAVARILRRYRDLPTSFADACLVRLSELVESGELLTLDSEFRVYRRQDRRVISVRMPADRQG